MANVFSLKRDHRDNRTEIIECKALGLIMIVHSPYAGNYQQQEDSLILTGVTYHFISPDVMDLKKTINYDFEILNVYGPASHKWNQALFYEAIEDYYKRYLKIELHGFTRNTMPDWDQFSIHGKKYIQSATAATS